MPELTEEMIRAVREHDCLFVRDGHTFRVDSNINGRPFRVVCTECDKSWAVRN